MKQQLAAAQRQLSVAQLARLEELRKEIRSLVDHAHALEHEAAELLCDRKDKAQWDDTFDWILDWAENRPELTTFDLLETLGVKPPSAKPVKA